jgi:hypothetical protein
MLERSRDKPMRPPFRRSRLHPVTGIHLIVLPGGGYSQHVAHEGEPIVGWLNGLSVRASVFRYPLQVRHPEPLNALRTEIRRLRDDGAERIGLIGFSGRRTPSRPGCARAGRFERSG